MAQRDGVIQGNVMPCERNFHCDGCPDNGFSGSYDYCQLGFRLQRIIKYYKGDKLIYAETKNKTNVAEGTQCNPKTLD